MGSVGRNGRTVSCLFIVSSETSCSSPARPFGRPGQAAAGLLISYHILENGGKEEEKGKILSIDTSQRHAVFLEGSLSTVGRRKKGGRRKRKLYLFQLGDNLLGNSGEAGSLERDRPSAERHLSSSVRRGPSHSSHTGSARQQHTAAERCDKKWEGGKKGKLLLLRKEGDFIEIPAAVKKGKK